VSYLLSSMAPKEDEAHKAAEIAIGSIGRGYDISSDIRLKFCKGDSIHSRLIEIVEDTDVRDVVLPGGVSLPNVSKLIKCDKGERTRFRSDVLSFQQVIFLFLPFLLFCFQFYLLLLFVAMKSVFRIICPTCFALTLTLQTQQG